MGSQDRSALSLFNLLWPSRETTAATPENYGYPPVYQLSGSASYVTGSHAFKTGAQWRFGPYRTSADANADLTERFRNGVPDSVIVYNTPVRSTERINADLGFFAQDSWKYRRLTVNPGIRFEYFNSSAEHQVGHVAQAHAEAAVESHATTDELGGKP